MKQGVKVEVHVILLGVSHGLRRSSCESGSTSRAAISGAAVEALALRPSAAETVVLSTCNRSEIYVASGDPAGRARK